ncbi:MAG: KH domain-containing protein [Candidatus Pacebacteria bacterium]|nr:KH domain-containing protein [Candidatus Paceibacterota bacterium]
MKINNYLTNLVQHLGLQEEDFSIKIDELEDEIKIDLTVPEEDTGLFIGYKAEVINSIQRVLRLIFAKEKTDKRISLNINNYREDRIEQIKEKLTDICERLEQEDGEYVFPFISSFERYNIHSLISSEESFTAFESYSEGEGASRRLIIRKKAD